MGKSLVITTKTKIKDNILDDIKSLYDINELINSADSIYSKKMTDNQGIILNEIGEIEEVICIVPQLDSRSGYISQQLIPILYNFILENLREYNLDLIGKTPIKVYDYNESITEAMKLNILCANILGIEVYNKNNKVKIDEYLTENKNISLTKLDELISITSSSPIGENEIFKLIDKTLIFKKTRLTPNEKNGGLTNQPYYFCIKAYPAIILALKEGYKINFDELLEEIYENNKTLNLFLKYALKINYRKILSNNFDLFNIKVDDNQEKFNKTLQKIVYGAPGTGKSYSLNEEVESIFGTNKERVTFYDGYTYGQFVGMYKPVTLTKKRDETEEQNIEYKYIPGPFMKQLVKAYKDSSNKFCLIIEEINRAKADKVFGNIFQLLDRDEKGDSRYPISASEEQIHYLREELKDKIDILERIENKGLYLPDNLYIWATMNSADDGVQPLDTAFKRRWRFNYISLNANEDKFGNGETFIIGQYKDKEILWNNFRTSLNDTLKVNITEDRLIAPFFISPNDFEEINTSIKKIDKNILSEKVLMYIFDDLLRHYPKLREKIFNNNIKTFSDIYEKVAKNDNFLELIFNEEFLKQLILGSDETDGKD
jgi:hypothetical protein